MIIGQDNSKTQPSQAVRIVNNEAFSPLLNARRLSAEWTGRSARLLSALREDNLLHLTPTDCDPVLIQLLRGILRRELAGPLRDIHSAVQ